MNQLRFITDRFRSWFQIACLVGVHAFLVATTRAQGTLTLIQTGGGGPVVSATVPLFFPVTTPEALLRFQFGFATAETLVPGSFSDAVTAAIANSNQLYLPVVTVDASGTVWAPGGLGTVQLSPSEVSWQAIVYPSTAPQFAFQQAWQVSVPVAKVFQGAPMTFYLDLFDNGNAVPSAAWFSDVFILAVPEPGVWSLVLLGCAALICAYRRSPS